jgi:serine/threonine protein kinase
MHPRHLCPERDLLQAFLRGTASESARLHVDDHLGQCDACRTLVQSLNATSVRTDQLSSTPSADATRPGYRSRPRPAAADTYSFLLPPAREDEIGRLGGYRVLSLRGQGAMGFVFHAEDLALNRAVALKVMKPDLDRDVRGWERFLREARVMASIKHESLVTVFQVGQENDVVYLAMELLEGRSLEDWLAGVGRPDVPTLLRLGREIADGLSAIHRRGLVHRDVKPANLWVEEPGGRLKILDFGLARFVNDAALTHAGTVLGTPCYMAPEQARGEPVDARGDLFSFGVVLYTLCTGTCPFQAENTLAALSAVALRNPCPVHRLNPDVPRSLSDLISQLLAKDPRERPASAEEVLERLRRIEGGLSDPAPKRRKARGSRSARRDRTQVLRARKSSPPRRPWGRVILAGVLAAGVLLAGAWAAWYGARRAGPRAAAGPEAGAAVVYLSALDPIDRAHWPIEPPLGPGMPPFRAIGGVRVQGKESAHGIFMHPPPAWVGAASLTYRLGGDFQTFRADVSLNDGPPGSEAPFVFAVYGDGQLLWKSRPLWSQADAQTCIVAVRGVDRLRIEVQSAGEPRGAHAVWIEPGLAR